MCDIAPDEMINRVLPSLLDSVEKSKDLFVRHGSILAIGQLVLGMSKQPCALEESLGEIHETLIADQRAEYGFITQALPTSRESRV